MDKVMDITFLNSPIMFGRNQDTDESDLGIREVADMLDISIRAIRFYEQKGLLTPRRDGRFRVYNESEVNQLRFIQEFRGIGLTIREIKILLADLNKARSEEKKSEIINQYLDKRLREIGQDIDVLRDQEYRVICMLGGPAASGEVQLEQATC